MPKAVGIRGVLDRAKPVVVEREGPSNRREHEGQVHGEQTHEEEREKAAARHKPRG